MIYNRFKYIGFAYLGFVFGDENDRRKVFNRCIKEFIENFELDQNDFVHHWFNIRYFTSKAAP
jgi:hypothetical protein